MRVRIRYKIDHLRPVIFRATSSIATADIIPIFLFYAASFKQSTLLRHPSILNGEERCVWQPRWFVLIVILCSMGVFAKYVRGCQRIQVRVVRGKLREGNSMG